MNVNRRLAELSRLRWQTPDFLARLLRDRRGATALIFAVSAIAFLGLAGFATEGGTWYLEKRHGQNAADAAAIAGLLQISADNAAGTTPGSDVTTAGDTIATSNGYTTGKSGKTTTTVTLTPGNYSSGSGFVAAAKPPWSAVRAKILRSPPRLFSGLFLGINPTISEIATAAFIQNPVGPSCMLALSGGLTFKGNETVTTDNCSIASNNTTSTSIDFKGSSASVTPPGSLYSAGGCSSGGSADQCSLASVGFPPVTDPYAAIQSVTMPPETASATTCENMPTSGTVPASATYEVSGKMFCDASFKSGKTTTTFTGDINLSGGTLNLSPGTYILYNASISITGGTLECTSCTPGGAGVTIILTGSPASSIGTISITGNPTINLNAPAVNSFNSAFDGVLFYMDKNAPNKGGVGSEPVKFTGTGTTNLTGGMYFPSVTVSDNGNITSTANCSEIVAYSVEVSGNATENVSGCNSVGTAVPQPYYVALVQ